MKLKLVTPPALQEAPEKEFEVEIYQNGNVINIEAAGYSIGSFRLDQGKLIFIKYSGIKHENIRTDHDGQIWIAEID